MERNSILKTLAGWPDRPEPWHDVRYTESLLVLLALGLTDTSQVFEIGDPGTFTRLLGATVGCGVRHSNGDLRELPAASPCYANADIALCMEVIEHVGEAKDNPRADWNYSGAKNCLAHAYQALKPGGLLFLSTPNICGVKGLEHLLNLRHPHSYQPHTHEYAPSELAALVSNCGFQRITLQTVNVWHNHGLAAKKAANILRLIRQAGANTAMRDDCIFLTAIRG